MNLNHLETTLERFDEFGHECNAVDEELLLSLEQERNEALASLRWALHMIDALLGAARNIDPRYWDNPDYDVACRRAGRERR